MRPRAQLRPSGPVPVNEAASLGRLLEIANQPFGASLQATLERMLDVLAELEPYGAAGLDAGSMSLRRGPARREGERMFADLGEELHVLLPGSSGGLLAFAAPSFTNAPVEAYEQLLRQAAGVFSLVIRASKGAEVTSDVVPSSLRGRDDEIAQLEKLAVLGQNASEIVHELSNPLTSILAYSDYLVERLRQVGVGQADLDRLMRIHESATRIQAFCRDLTQYARPAADLEAVNVQAVIDRALRFCVHGLRGADIAVERDYGDVPAVRGVETSLTQVFVNLVTNAWHAMAESGGRLRISTSLDGEWVVVEIADDGHGIPDEVLHRVFDPYFSTKPRDRGVGLGLSIVRQIIQEHGGSIRADNHNGGGAVFILQLPSR